METVGNSFSTELRRGTFRTANEILEALLGVVSAASWNRFEAPTFPDSRRLIWVAKTNSSVEKLFCTASIFLLSVLLLDWSKVFRGRPCPCEDKAHSTGYRLDSSSCTGTWTGRTSFVQAKLHFHEQIYLLFSHNLPTFDQFTAESWNCIPHVP
jgi:hypothetical protein